MQLHFKLIILTLIFLAYATFSLAQKIKLNDTIFIDSLIKAGDKYESYNPDSAKNLYTKAQSLSSKKYNETKNIAYLKRLSKTYRYIAAYHYYKGDFDDALSQFQLALKYDKLSGDSVSVAETYNDVSQLYRDMGNIDEAIECLKISERIYNNRNYSEGLILVYNDLGRIQYELGNYTDALKYYQNALSKISVSHPDTTYLAITYLNIGLVNDAQNNVDYATDYYNKSLELFQAIGDKRNVANCYNNLAGIYNFRNSNFEKAYEYYEKALAIYTDLKSTKGISVCNNNIAGLFYKNGKYELALDVYKNNLKVKQEMGDKKGEIISFYNISACFFALNNFKESLKFALDGLNESQKLKSLYESRIGAKKAFESYYELKDYKNAADYHVLYMQLNDSIYNVEKERNFSQLEAQYQNKQKKLEIDNLNKEKELQEVQLLQKDEKLKNFRNVTILFVVIIALITLFLAIVLRLLKARKKANIKLAHQNEEILQKNEEITAQRDEIEAQNTTVLKQKEQIEYIHNELKSSIHYALRIQTAMLPDEIFIKEILQHYFIIYFPRDIVSGDFYWVGQKDNKKIIAIVDCTGHGVPGAFMSMLGVALLNEIINKESLVVPGEILDRLRNNIINALKQHGQADQSTDGMDISLIAIDTTPQAKTSEGSETQTSEGSKPSEVLWAYAVQWAGANNPLYVIARNEITKQSISGITSPSVRNDEIELHELKGDKMPIGVSQNMQPFTTHTIELFDGDMIYMMTDGYKDQFGEASKSKFLSKNLKKLLIENCRLNMNEQKEVLIKTYQSWKGNAEQVDDILVFGLKI